MHVEPFTDQYDAVAALIGRSASELRARVAPRWLAIDAGRAVAVATATTRPDRRTFVSLAGDLAAYGELIEAVGAAARRPLHAHADCADAELRGVLAAAGFVEVMVAESFRVRFADALDALHKARTAPWFTLIAAGEADHGRLFTLDNAIRQDVPGADGWRGDRAMFLDELADPAAYAVAVDETNGEYAGLARVWRNPSGPRFGLVGVLRQYRGTRLGPALIRGVLEEAAGWGHESFVTETSLTNRAVHPRLARLAAERLGQWAQMRRPVSLR